MWLPETWAQPGEGEEQECWAIGEQPPTTSSGEGSRKRCFSDRSLQAERRALGPMGLEQSCED